MNIVKPKRMVAFLLGLILTISSALPAYAQETVDAEVSVVDGELVFLVETEEEAEILLKELEEASMSAKETYERAVMTGKSQNPDAARYLEPSDEESNISICAFATSDVARKSFNKNGNHGAVMCYITYDRVTDGTVKRIGTVYDRSLYIEQDGSISNKVFSEIERLDSGRTVAFSYSCTATIKTTAGVNTSTVVSAYCEFYANGGSYCE